MWKFISQIKSTKQYWFDFAYPLHRSATFHDMRYAMKYNHELLLQCSPYSICLSFHIQNSGGWGGGSDSAYPLHRSAIFFMILAMLWNIITKCYCDVQPTRSLHFHIQNSRRGGGGVLILELGRGVPLEIFKLDPWQYHFISCFFGKNVRICDSLHPLNISTF